MICTEARTRMLEAERRELEGRGDSELALHVRRCAACRALAGRLVREQDALGSALASVPAPSLEEVLERLRYARRGVASVPPVPVAVRAREARPSPRRARAWWPVPAVAAAAVLLAVALWDDASGPAAESGDPSLVSAPPTAALPSSGALPSPERAAPPPVVEAGDREVAVFTTSNPNITVAWIYQEPIE